MSALSSAKTPPEARSPLISRAVLWTVLFALLLTVSTRETAHCADLAGDAQLKSKYILNFAKLVEWPAVPGATEGDRFLIGICGDPYLWKACRSGLSGEKIGGSQVKLTPLSFDKAMVPADEMKVLFIYSDDEEKMKSLIAALADRPIVLISDYPDFCQMGGSIGLVSVGDRMMFEVNRSQETRTGLKFNSRLLRVARQVLE